MSFFLMAVSLQIGDKLIPLPWELLIPGKRISVIGNST